MAPVRRQHANLSASVQFLTFSLSPLLSIYVYFAFTHACVCGTRICCRLSSHNLNPIKDVVTSLRDKLCLSADEHFSLVLEHVKSLKRNKLTLLDPEETLARVSFQPYIFFSR